MIRIEKNTRLGREEILRRASEYFGENGVGLSETCRNRCTIAFEGAGGYLSATIIEKDAERLVEVESREFEYFAQRFLDQV